MYTMRFENRNCYRNLLDWIGKQYALKLLYFFYYHRVFQISEQLCIQSPLVRQRPPDCSEMVRLLFYLNVLPMLTSLWLKPSAACRNYAQLHAIFSLSLFRKRLKSTWLVWGSFGLRRRRLWILEWRLQYHFVEMFNHNYSSQPNSTGCVKFVSTIFLGASDTPAFNLLEN